MNQLGEEIDPNKQQPLLAQINDLYLDESYTNVVATFPVKLIAQKKVQGIDFPLFATFGVTGVWIAAS